MPVLKEAFDMASPNFSNILKTLKPDLLVNDFLQPWAVEAAKENNIPAVEFISSSATMSAYMLHVFKKPGTLFPFSEKIHFRDYEIARNAKLRESAAKQDKVKNREIKCLELSSNIVLIKSFKEIEGKYINYFSSLANKKLVPLGPLAQDSVNDDEDSKIIQWLNKKDLNSTVFVSFGSEYFLSNEDLEEIAHGLELSGVNFIWVVRFPMGENIRVDEKLPKGFFKRVGERGLVVEGWAPQAKILRHLNVGGFVSHCGWSSVMEGLTFGVPIIAMPMHLDQPINARLVTEVGVGMEVVRDKNGKLEREEVAAVIKQVVVEKSGEVVRKKARNMKEKIRMKGEEEIDVVVEELKKLCMK
ncbi:hypothetical protein LguiA_016706 [Lonicera macranthoides]